MAAFNYGRAAPPPSPLPFPLQTASQLLAILIYLCMRRSSSEVSARLLSSSRRQSLPCSFLSPSPCLRCHFIFVCVLSCAALCCVPCVCCLEAYECLHKLISNAQTWTRTTLGLHVRTTVATSGRTSTSTPTPTAATTSTST